MTQTVQFHRPALGAMFRGPWTEIWIATPRLETETVALFLPHLQREGARVRVLTDLSPSRSDEGSVEPKALKALAALPGCEIRSLPGLAASVYAVAPQGPALVSSAPLTMNGLDGPLHCGVLLDEATGVLEELNAWWSAAHPIDRTEAARLAKWLTARRQARALSEEIARLGAFVRVSVRGTRRTRRLDPREFGVTGELFGPVSRPVEFQFYRLDELVKAKDDLEQALGEQGLEWNGYYLVPRQFLEQDWPRLFGTKQRQLLEHLNSPEAKSALKEQLGRARADLELWLGRLLPAADSQGLSAEAWIDQQATRILAETVSDTILEESGLEYRVLTILPEDERSVEELQKLLQDPKLRSVQLTFRF
ncbi:MAG TPA: hypothetical protein VGK74_10605 [Symbiobacteriaceae bacterium]|jgi:hypothetical protein